MSASAANAHPEKRATPAALSWPAQPLTSPSAGEANKVRTRSATDAQALVKPPNKFSEACKSLIAYHLIPEMAACSAQSMAEVLHALAESYKMPANIAKAIGHVAKILQHIEQWGKKDSDAKSLPDLIKEMQSNISAEMDSKLTALESRLTLPSTAQKQLEFTAKELGLAAECIKTSTNDIGKSIAQVTDTSSQLANTATSYKDALLKSSKHATDHSPDKSAQVDPRITRDIERKTRQILVDTLDPKIAVSSLAELKEKVNEAIKAISDPPPPTDTTVLDIKKLRKGGFTIIFKEKDVVKWLQDIDVQLKFTAGISPDASITSHVYSILAPRVTLSFNPSVKEHLWEIEECNNLPAGTIEKARWIKPEYKNAQPKSSTRNTCHQRRKHGQHMHPRWPDHLWHTDQTKQTETRTNAMYEMQVVGPLCTRLYGPSQHLRDMWRGA